jgi:hypothetical protein
MGNYAEGRRGMRFPVEARVIFKWADETGNTREGEGRTLNISERGAFVIAPKFPRVGTMVEVKMFLPRLPITTHVGTVVMNATIIRNEEQMSGRPGERGFAIERQSWQGSA